ncbi:MAG: 30S ribosomal protein S8 [bacterium]|nr:30S ribosomal protein S8 [bacterium]
MYINLLINIKNNQEAGKNFFKIPFSKMDLAIAELLLKQGYLKSVEAEGKAVKKVIEITLKEGKAVKGIKFVSKPSRRMYAGYKEIRSVKSGYGMEVISTPKGIMSDKEARKQKLGGQLLFKIW